MSKSMQRPTIECPQCHHIKMMPPVGKFQCTDCKNDFVLCVDGVITPLSTASIKAPDSVDYQSLIRKAQKKSIQNLRKPVFRAIEASIAPPSDHTIDKNQRYQVPEFHKNYLYKI